MYIYIYIIIYIYGKYIMFLVELTTPFYTHAHSHIAVQLRQVNHLVHVISHKILVLQWRLTPADLPSDEARPGDRDSNQP